MNISIFGLGYVGCVGAACLAKLGHKVIGVDVNENKVRLMNEGKPTIIEDGIAELCQEAHSKGLMSATTVASEAIKVTEISFIVVGTPSSKEGHLNLNYIYTVAGRIGRALKEKKQTTGLKRPHIVAIRSTVLPGTNAKVGEIIEQESSLVRGEDFTVVSNPEFLREGTSVEDYFNPPLTLVGTDSKYAEETFRELYKDIHAEFICTDIKVAEVSGFVYAVIALGINQSAYNAEFIRAALLSVGEGQIEAASALGMTYLQALRRIILPEAITVALPSLGNSFISVIKGTSLAFTCAVVEMTAQGKILGGRTYRYFEVYVSLAIIYWVITIIIEQLLKAAEKKIAIPDQVANYIPEDEVKA